MNAVRLAEIDSLEPYQVVSRREILLLLRGIKDTRQLIKMTYKRHGDAVVTTLLDIDPENGWVTVDCAQDEAQNRHILACDNLSFDTSLQKVRIMFFTDHVESCVHDDKPAFRFAIPTTVIRLQRREVFRVRVPRTPVVIPHEAEPGNRAEVTAYMQDISMGGIGMLEESMTLDNTIGRVYENCRVTLADKSVIIVKLEIRNTQEISLANGKLVRRIGCQFVDLPNTTKLSLQRLITKIEREKNATALTPD